MIAISAMTALPRVSASTAGRGAARLGLALGPLLVASLSVAEAQTRTDETEPAYIVLEDFESSPVGELPAGWTWKASDEDKDKPYRVREEDGNRYLEARDEGQSVILAKEVKWDLNEYPFISFRVRVHATPEGGNECLDEKVDSAAGIYVTYRRMLGLVPESVKYVWSSTLWVGAAAIRSGVGRPWQIVIGSREEGLGEWRTYVFDLRDAYRKTFGGEPPHEPMGVGVLSDANSTESRAYADYDDFRVLREAGPGVDGGVSEIICKGDERS